MAFPEFYYSRNVFGLRSPVFFLSVSRLPSPVSRLPSPDFGLRTPDSGLPTSIFHLPSSIKINIFAASINQFTRHQETGMYSVIKKSLRTFIPKKVLFAYEPLFRSALYPFYKGNRYHCNVCNRGLRNFIEIKNDKLCPMCGSLGRVRQLQQLLDEKYLFAGMKILDFSPSRSLYRELKKNKTITYISSDLSGDFLADKQYDITEIDAPDNSFDLIICYHILEHVPDDEKAMAELFRVLKRGGICLMQTPFKEGDIYENDSITTPEDRLQHFGQEDHVRIYSVAGLNQRLQKAGFTVSPMYFKNPDENTLGLSAHEVVLEVKK